MDELKVVIAGKERAANADSLTPQLEKAIQPTQLVIVMVQQSELHHPWAT